MFSRGRRPSAGTTGWAATTPPTVAIAGAGNHSQLSSWRLLLTAFSNGRDRFATFSPVLRIDFINDHYNALWALRENLVHNLSNAGNEVRLLLRRGGRVSARKSDVYQWHCGKELG